ncbi:MAG TPA: cation diffusion facilitator family transporter [Gemmataceae bacterium]|nr:cation diffusion facilitator family transporter [Gemmataceae bacterium]
MAHDQGHGGAVTGRYLGLAIGLTTAFVVAEAVAGWLSNSLALLADAGHNFADALALVFTWYALRLARRPADARRTFGSHRAGILAALANAATLVALALLIFWEAVQRLREPEPVASGPMIGVALAAVVLNGIISLWLRGEARHDLNLRGAYLHMLGDALSALGVVAAGVLVALTGSTLADPLVSLLVGGLIVWSSWGILSEAVNVLMEAAPRSLDMAELERSLRQVPGVRDVHDLHVWTVASGIVACSCHVVVAEQSVREGQQVLRAVADLLRDRFHITHTTVQVEVEGCEPNDMYCTLRPIHAAHRHHSDKPPG